MLAFVVVVTEPEGKTEGTRMVLSVLLRQIFSCCIYILVPRKQPFDGVIGFGYRRKV